MVEADEVLSHPRRARDTHADAVRGVGIAALVLSHTLTIATQTPQVAGLNGFIIAWNMPVFFFVSGWAMALQAPRAPLSAAKRRARSLLIPYLAWICLLWVVGYPWSGGEGGVGTWFQILFAPREMWFLYCLFLASVLFAAVRQLGRSPAVVLGGVIVVALAATALSQRAPEGLLTLADLGWLLPFLAVGYYGCRIAQDRRRLPTLAKAALAVVALAVLWFVVGPGLFRFTVFGFWPLSLIAGNSVAAQLVNHAARYALATAGIATVWQLVRLLSARAAQALSSLGTATLGIYALNSPLLTLVRVWFPSWSLATNPAFTILIVLATALIVLGVGWLITLLLGRVEITRHVLLGRWASPPSKVAT